MQEISLPVGSVVTGAEIVNQFGSTWVNIHYTVTPEYQMHYELVSPYRVLCIRLIKSDTDKGPAIYSAMDTDKPIE